MRCVIFANGEITDQERVKAFLHPDDYLIAADGGMRHLQTFGLTPHAVIGDLDSLPAVETLRLEQAGTRLFRFSPHKDETDLELALRHALTIEASEICILGALGTRLDQSLANILLLALPELAGRKAYIVEGNQIAFLARGGEPPIRIEGQEGDTISLIPLAGDAIGVTARGLQWPLNRETLYFGRTRGISNVLRAPPAAVQLEHGLLLCVVATADGNHNAVIR